MMHFVPSHSFPLNYPNEIFLRRRRVVFIAAVVVVDAFHRSLFQIRRHDCAVVGGSRHANVKCLLAEVMNQPFIMLFVEEKRTRVPICCWVSMRKIELHQISFIIKWICHRPNCRLAWPPPTNPSSLNERALNKCWDFFTHLLIMCYKRTHLW